jgi:glycosyltransferase involved in cell wall biosynthesis
LNVLFVHQNFPGQYKHLLNHLAASREHDVVFMTQRPNTRTPNVKQIVYRPAGKPAAATHRYLHGTEAAILNAQAAWKAATKLRQQGFKPDLIVGHNGWGETLFLKDVFPDAPLLGYFEFFYSARGVDVGFDPEFPSNDDGRLRTSVMNAVNLMGLEAADWGQSPTQWQRDQYPARYHPMLTVVHEGIDTETVRPDPKAWVELKARGIRLRAGDEVITYVARNLEPYRGFHVFMRALPALLKRRPNAHVLIVGGDEVSYGASLPKGQTYRKKMLAEVGSELDGKRVHFFGRLPYELYLKVLQVSAAHLYLTYPFVLSWSMLEAMAAGCAVVASRTPPVEEVLRDGENGVLVDFFSTAEIVDAIDRVLEDPERTQRMRAAARQTIVERYDLRSVSLPQQLELLRSVKGSRRA